MMNKLLKGLQNMSEFESLKSSDEAKYSVYILEVLPLSDSCKYDFYVGSTGLSIEDRHKQHKSGGAKSARIFRSRATVGEIRWDLMDGFPKFRKRETVERAEGRVAQWLANRGFSVRCDRLAAEQ